MTKNRLVMFGIFSLIAVAMIGVDQANAQSISMDGFEINAEESAIVIGLGLGAGILVAYQGFRTTPEDFDGLKFLDGVIKNTLASVPLAIGAAVAQTELNVFVYAIIFFAAMGISTQYSYSRKKTIPNNATEEEIENILRDE